MTALPSQARFSFVPQKTHPSYVVAFDVESWLMGRGRIAPRMVCGSWDTQASQGVLDGNRFINEFEKYLDDSRYLLVAHNFQFDLAVICAYAPRLLRKVFEGLRDNRFACTKIRQTLLDIAEGTFRGEPTDDGSWQAHGYGLDDLCERFGLPPLDKSGASWRLRFSELDGIPAEQYPPEATSYSLNDSIAARAVYFKQNNGQPVLYEAETCRHAFALQLSSVWGIRSDGASVAELERVLTIEANELMAKMQAPEIGIYRTDRTKDTKRLKALVEAAFAKMGLTPPLTDKGNIKCDADTLQLSADPVLMALGDGQGPFKLLNTFIPALKAATEIPLQPGYEVLVITGRTASKNPVKKKKGEIPVGINIQQIPKDRRDEDGNILLGTRNCFVARSDFLLCSSDYNVAELRALGEVHYQLFGRSALRDAFIKGIDPHLVMAATILQKPLEWVVANKKTREVKDARQFAKCFHPDTEILTRDSGWKKISELTMQDEVASVVPGEKSRLEWVKPLRLTTREATELVHLKNEGIDLRVTPDHRMLGFNVSQDRKKTKKFVTCTPEELNSKRGFLNAAFSETETLEVDERLLRLAVATQADGSFCGSRQIRFGFSKTRKIERLQSLLIDGEFTKSTKKNGKYKDTTTFYIRNDLTEKIKTLLEGKNFPSWWTRLSPHCREVILDEVRYWDSCTRPKGVAYEFCSTKKQNIDILQAIASITGRKTRQVREKRKDPKHADAYKLTVRMKGDSRGDNIQATREAYNGPVFCLTVPSECVLVRDGGITVVTQQCGNFGVPGGLGPDSLIAFARSTYGIIISRGQAEFIIENFHKTWPEQRMLFRYVSEKIGQNQGPITQVLGTPLVHGARRFTQACNLLFQGAVSQVAKEAVWRATWEMYLGTKGWRAENDNVPSPLLGSRIAAFIHDEILAEIWAPGRKVTYSVHKAAMRLSQVMCEVMKEYFPNTPAVAEPALMVVWDKECETWVGEDGLLEVWSREEMMRREAAAKAEKELTA